MKIRQSLSMKLALVSVGLTLLLSLLFSGLQIFQDFQKANLQYESNFQNIQNATQLALSRAVYTLDTDLAMEIITGITANDYIKKITLYDELGTVLAGKEIEIQQVRTLNHWLTNRIFEEYRTYDFELPNLVDSTEIQGRLVIIVDNYIIMNTFIERATISMRNDFLKSIGMLLVFILTFYHFVSRPLSKMNESISSITPKNPGDNYIPIEDANKLNEIGLVSSTVNSFVKEVTKLQNAQLQSEKALQDSHDTLSTLMDHLPHAIYLKSESGEFLFQNQSLLGMISPFKNLTDYQKNLKRESQIDFFDADDQVFHTGRDSFIHDLEWEMPDGQFRYYEIRKELIVFNSNKTLISVATDITDRKRYAASIQHMAFHDSLTDLPNRSLFQDRLEQAIQLSERNGLLGALLFIDLDNFKKINDSLGHKAGDVLLRTLSARFSQQVKIGRAHV